MTATETEVKFYLDSARAAMRQRLVDMEAESLGRVFERNVRFEDDNRRFLKNRSLLRLRQSSAATTLTFKAPLGTAEDGQFKSLEELEVTVSDFDTMQTILQRLAFQPVQVYEKWRETFTTSSVEICLDTMPFGEFMEIEGTGPDIMATANALGLPWERRILKNYLGIFEHIRNRLALPFTDVTFDNFKTVSTPVTHLIRDFETGTPAPDGFR